MRTCPILPLLFFLITLGLASASTQAAQQPPPANPTQTKPTNPVDGQTPSAEITHAKPAPTFLVLPLKIYRLKAPDLSQVNCTSLADSDFHRIIAKANIIWSAAGIHWLLQSIEDIPAEKTSRIKLLALADDNNPALPGSTTLPHHLYRDIIPDSTRTRPIIHRVFYVHSFDVNGVYFGRAEAMVKETASLRPVDGGIDEPLPRVTSHELGHSLGLPHRQNRLNLMASGTTGTLLNTQEIETVRKVAAENPLVLTYHKLQEKLTSDIPLAEKQRLRRALDQINALASQPIHPVPSADHLIKALSQPLSNSKQ